jgi:hypothetical protein
MRTPSWDAAVLDAKRLIARAQRCQIYQFCDSFDNYNTATKMYDTVQGTPAYSSAYARFAPPAGLPGQGIQFSGNTWVRKNLGVNITASAIPKIAVYFGNGLGGNGTRGNPFFSVLDNGSPQWSLIVFQNGAVGILTGSYTGGTVIYQTGPGVVMANSYPSFECSIPVGASVTAQVWMNGAQIINASGINTQSTANAYFNQVAIGDLDNSGLGGSRFYMDDFRVWDSTGGTQNAALGTDSRMVTKLASGAGAFTQWTPNGAAANWQCVDDDPPDDDTSYVSGATIGLQDSYAVPSAGFTAAPAMVVARFRMRKDDGATRSVEIGASQGATAGVAGGILTIGSTYAFIDCCIADDPATILPWTAAGADTAQPYKYETA